MRLRFRLYPVGGEATLPVQYNILIQGLIYRHLGSHLAQTIHDRGIVDGKRHLRMFSFSRLLARGQVDGQHIRFTGTAGLVVTSPWAEFLETLAVRIAQASTIRLGPAEFFVESVEVVRDDPYAPVAVVEALSPITVYSTLFTSDGRRKTYYYSPFEPEFERLLLQNLVRKARAWYGETPSLEGAAVRPVRVRAQDQRILLYKGTVIKGWLGLYEMRLPEPLYRMALDAGLGAKNSQGLGCIELCRPGRNVVMPDEPSWKGRSGAPGRRPEV